MNTRGVVTLRLFSGPHMGAELVLSAGSHVIGSDDSCDIILNDTSVTARHVRLLVTLPETEARPEANAEKPPKENSGSTANQTAAEPREENTFGAQEDDDLKQANCTLDEQQGAGGVPEVQIFALDGQALVDGEPLGQGQFLLPQTPCFLGLTCLAWAACDQQEMAWQAVIQRLHPSGSATESQENTEQQEPAGTATDDADVTAADDNVNTDAETLRAVKAPLRLDQRALPANTIGTLMMSEAQRVRSKHKKSLRVLLLLLVLLGLCGLTISYNQHSAHLAQYVDIIKQQLKDAGFEGLQVLRHERGVIIEGLLSSDKERGELVRLAQSVHFPVYLDVEVSADILNAITAAFNSREFYPLVQRISGDQGEALYISGYMKDGLIEQWGFSSVNEDVPELAKVGAKGVVRHIRHASDVAAVLTPALARAELGFVQVAYHPGSIELAGTFDTDQQKRLEMTLDVVRAELGIPLTVKVRTALAETVKADSRADEAGMVGGAGNRAVKPGSHTSTEPVVNSPADIKVLSVTMTPMRFVTLGSGERVFEGGLLPGGFTLESINTQMLKLRKDGRILDYQLRGSNE